MRYSKLQEQPGGRQTGRNGLRGKVRRGHSRGRQCFVDTNWTRGRMNASDFDRFRSQIEDMTPLGKMTTADDVAESALCLITGGSSITGQLLVIDGGNHLTINEANL